MIATAVRAGIEAEGIRVTIEDVPILTGVDVRVAAGEWVGLVGPNGAGKSTLLRALAGVQDCSGAIRLGDRSLSEMARREVAQTVALVPQHPVVPPGVSVFEYVLLGRNPHISYWGVERPADLARAQEALDRLGIGAFADRRLTTLSGGERQRVVLSRALAQDAPILLLDEPTTGLDLGHQQHVLELVDIERRESGLAVVSAMHDLTLAAQYGDRLVFLDRGAVVAEGAAGEVLTTEFVADRYGAEVVVLEHLGRLIVAPLRTP